MQEKIQKEIEDINKKALEAYMQELEKRGGPILKN